MSRKKITITLRKVSDQLFDSKVRKWKIKRGTSTKELKEINEDLEKFCQEYIRKSTTY